MADTEEKKETQAASGESATAQAAGTVVAADVKSGSKATTKTVESEKAVKSEKKASRDLGEARRSGNPARRREAMEQAVAETARKEKLAAKRNERVPEPDEDSPSWADGVPLSPRWWAPTFITLLLVGLAWLLVYYFTSAVYPIPGLGGWNLAIGLIVMFVGFLMTLKWR